MYTKIIFIISFLLFSSWGHAQVDTAVECQDVPLTRGNTGAGGGGVLRSIRMPARAYIIGSELTIDFIIPLENVNVVTTNLSTGEVVYSGICSSPQSIEIDLSMEDTGNYQLCLSSSSLSLYGNFLLE